VIPILTSERMREADALAVAVRGGDALINDAGTAVALEAKRLLGSCYGARVAVLLGPGLNGADGRVAGGWLRARGAKVDFVDFSKANSPITGVDLVIDAMFGTGRVRPFDPVKVAPGIKVLAVDIPSGIDADTGEVVTAPIPADVTIALGAIKPAHLSGPSTAFVGELRFAGLGIVTSSDDGLLDDSDFASLIEFERDDHKWVHALEVFAGSTLMPGAAELVTRGALAGGASMIRLSSNGEVGDEITLPPEIVRVNEGRVDPRCRAVVAGPGLGTASRSWLRERLSGVAAPVLLDADSLDRTLIDEIAPKNGTWVLTPHEGEFARLVGRPVSTDRFGDVRALARATDCVVLLKGPITVIANPNGALRVVNVGTPALATAGAGDVLAGLIGATIARGHDPFEAAAIAAHLHARAGSRLDPYATASDIIREIRLLLHQLANRTTL
jgi:hydroxyethylthiazole kinase-like uncharacterized protein yjeF